MTAMLTCITCGKTENDGHIEIGRNHCTACRVQKQQKRQSATYESYLSTLYSNAKSANKQGKRTKEREFSIAVSDLVELWQRQNGRCAISGAFLTHHKDGSGAKDFNASIDRVSNVKGYTTNNIQLVAYRINLMKHTLPEDMFYWWIKTIHDFSCD
tara:strand:+ start:1093 stop:1560 length:468 start_codon:yes stop_codon:yes gene_type:complete